MNRPVHIVAIDGPSGVGKSTVLPVVVREFAERGMTFTAVSSVEGTPLETLIRELALEAHPGLALSLAVSASRAIARERGTGDLLFDRFVLSSLVYQTFSGLDREFVYASNRPLLDGALTISLHLPPEDITRRRAHRPPRALDYFKRHLKLDDELRLFAEGEQQLRSAGHLVEEVDASGDPQEVARRVVRAVMRSMPDG